MRKYEPKGGVVPLEWKAGEPSRDNRGATVIAEVWGATLDWQLREVDVRARLVVMQWAMDTDSWSWPNRSAGEKVRRHASLAGTRYAHLPLTLEDWPR